MDKKEFIGKLIKMFPNSFTEQNTKMWLDVYNKIFPENLNYDELFNDLLNSHNTTNIPSVASLTALVNKQKERIAKEKEIEENQQKIQRWAEERREIEKHDKPVENVLSPLEILEQANIPFKGIPFDKRQLDAFRKYINTIPNSRVQNKLYIEICKMIAKGGVNELCKSL